MQNAKHSRLCHETHELRYQIATKSIAIFIPQRKLDTRTNNSLPTKHCCVILITKGQVESITNYPQRRFEAPNPE